MKIVSTLVLVLLLAACDAPTETAPTGPGNTDEECPRADGEPCR